MMSKQRSNLLSWIPLLAVWLLFSPSLVAGFVLRRSPSARTTVPRLHHGVQTFRFQASDHSDFDFDQMSNLVDRLDDLESSAPDILFGFYEPHLNSFSVKPGTSDRLSVTSTCYSLLAIQNSNAYGSMVSYIQEEENGDYPNAIPIPKVVQSLLASKWREEDLFQVPLLLYTILKMDKDRSMIFQSASANEDVASKLRQLIAAVLNARPRRRAGDRQAYSDYITYQVCEVLALLQETTERPGPPTTMDQKADFSADFESENDFHDDNLLADTPELRVGGLPGNAVPDGAASEISLALARCAEHRQLAYRTAGDSTSFDVIRLAYSLLTYIRSRQSLSGVAGRELVPGGGVAPGTSVGSLNRRLVVAALDAFFAEQNNYGLWDKGQPIFQSFRRQGRNVGNAFVFAVDTVASLLASLPAEYFRPHLSSLEKTLHWIEGHQSVEVIPDYCDPESGECYGKPLRGWASPHLRPDMGPQAWSTAQVLSCISLLKTTIQVLMHTDVLEEFNGISFSKKGIRYESWDRLLDTDLGSAVANRTIKSVLEERVITPFADSIYNPSYGAAYSAILHGPPGTAKTTICESLAQRMGYDFVVIDTAAFLASGLSDVANRIRYVFSRLMALQQCVILFDEIEEFALDREKTGITMESRMLTTSMLTAINDLRKAQKSVFFVATNRLRAFDSAIVRPGRFDLQLFVGTPNLDARVIQFQKKLAALSLSSSEKEQAITTYRSYLDSVWTQDAMFMNYLEGMQFASAAAELVKNHPERKLDTEQLSAILAQQAAVMTVRGAVRDEYLASMKMSRV